MIISEIIKKYRKEKGLTQSALASLIRDGNKSKSQSFIAHIEQNRYLPDQETFEKIIDILDLFSKKEELLELLKTETLIFKKNKIDNRYVDNIEKFNKDFNNKKSKVNPLVIISTASDTPSEIMEKERLSKKIILFTKEFWGDIYVVKKYPIYGELIINNMKKGVEYTYIYPSNKEEEANILKSRYSEYNKVSFYPVENLDDFFLPLSCQEIALFNLRDKTYENNRYIGFYIDFLGISSKDNDSNDDSIIHLAITNKETLNNIIDFAKRIIFHGQLQIIK